MKALALKITGMFHAASHVFQEFLYSCNEIIFKHKFINQSSEYAGQNVCMEAYVIVKSG